MHDKMRQQKQQKLLEEKAQGNYDPVNYMSIREKRSAHIPTRKELLMMKKED